MVLLLPSITLKSPFCEEDVVIPDCKLMNNDVIKLNLSNDSRSFIPLPELSVWASLRKHIVPGNHLFPGKAHVRVTQKSSFIYGALIIERQISARYVRM